MRTRFALGRLGASLRLALLQSPWVRFAWHVLVRFQKRRGLLLSGAVAYNVLLSIAPLIGLLIVALSRVADRESLIRILEAELQHLFPSRAAGLIQEAAAVWEHRETLGALSLVSLLFFGSLAFRVLGDAMTAIFADVRRSSKRVRGFWASAAVPFLFVGVLVVGLVFIAVTTTVIEGLSARSWSVPGLDVSLDPIQRWPLLGGALIGEFALFTLVYLVLPGVRVRVRDAVVASIVVVIQWEIVRHGLIWYFANLSTIGVLYGSLATVVIVLISAEIAAIILLLGAQVLAELTYARQNGIRWQDLPAQTAQQEIRGDSA